MNKSEANFDETDAARLSQSKKLNSVTLKDTVLKNVDVGITTSPFLTLDNTADFNGYLKENTKPVFDENNNKLSGEVWLSFEVSKKGRPHRIKVIRSSVRFVKKKQ